MTTTTVCLGLQTTSTSYPGCDLVIKSLKPVGELYLSHRKGDGREGGGNRRLMSAPANIFAFHEGRGQKKRLSPTLDEYAQITEVGEVGVYAIPVGMHIAHDQ